MDTGACRDAALRLHEYLSDRFVQDDGSIAGPDPGVSLNLRLTRFVKSYLRAIPWRDRLYYLQAQAYWIWNNAVLADITTDRNYADAALRCASVVASRQTDEGWWHYPQAEWKNRVATVEGCFGALCLLMGFNLSLDQRLLDGAIKWHDYMVEKVGFQDYDSNSKAINYFSNVGRGLVPNNSTLAVWFGAALAKAADEEKYLEHCPAMVRFLARCQTDEGELPYVLKSEHGPGRVHYLCFQYNAFQFLDLYEYYLISKDDLAWQVMQGLAGFLSSGLTEAGDARHDCEVDNPVIHYFTAAVSAALTRASQIGLGDYRSVAARGYDRLLGVQKADGGFDYSLGDYGILSDRRSYPRNQAMILRHLLVGASEEWQ
ncbi:MAG: hypothetical protein GX141_09280 [Armatimonadetes bacterium]|jgi:hypothetical protein|nr:hypothetical protein [Armatimonadota bacterium]